MTRQRRSALLPILRGILGWSYALLPESSPSGLETCDPDPIYGDPDRTGRRLTDRFEKNIDAAHMAYRQGRPHYGP